MKKIQQAIHSYFQDKDRQHAGIAFDECFPKADPAPLVWFSRSVAAGLAAALFVTVFIVYGALRDAPPGTSPIAWQQSLQNELLISGKLPLSERQSRQMERLLTQNTGAGDTDLTANLAQVKGELFQIVAGNRELDLSGKQTRILAGLMSSWEPRVVDGRIVDNQWMDEAGLTQFLASCADYCHQDTSPALMQDYLADCVMRSFAIPCSSLQTGYRTTGIEAIP